ncbi:MAG: hypothetical protein ABWX92_05970, partial [Mycetocola sp.]
MTETVPQHAEKADGLSQAEAAVFEAIRVFRRTLEEGPPLDSAEISYKPSTALIDDQRYRLDSVNTLDRYPYDGVLSNAAASEYPDVQVTLLSLSPHWEDRIRAVALRESIRSEITLPDGFPCIYEPADSPRNADHLRPSPVVWVASPDEAMLHELLPLYEELWNAYENQWPHSPNRTFKVGRLDRLSPHGVYR